MLSVRYHPEIATPELLAGLRPHLRYDAEGLFSAFLAEDEPLPHPLDEIAEAVCLGKTFRAVILRGYRDGRASTPCHSDRGATGFCMILSLGATRTMRFHRNDGIAACGNPLDTIDVACPNGTVVCMEEWFQNLWHHQLAPDPGVTEERLSLVFRASPERK